MKTKNSILKIKKSFIDYPLTNLEKKIIKEVKSSFECKRRIWGYSFKKAKKECYEELELFFDRIRLLVKVNMRNND